MKVSAYHSHLNGHEWLVTHQPSLWHEIVRTLSEPDGSPASVASAFREKGWKPVGQADGGRDGMSTPDGRGAPTRAARQDANHAATRGSQPLIKNRVLLTARLSAEPTDLWSLVAVHLAFYVGNEIDLGVEILPMKAMQEQMSSGPGYYEGALYDVARQGRGVPAVPLVLVGVLP
jgi:hypothetical protein